MWGASWASVVLEASRPSGFQHVNDWGGGLVASEFVY